MQSLVTDPQFTSQMGLVNDLRDGGLTAAERQQFKGHTTKNTKGNPNTLFSNDALMGA